MAADHYYSPQMYVGVGIDPSDLTKQKSCPVITSNALVRDQSSGTRTTKYSSGKITSEASYLQTRNIDVNISAQYGVFQAAADLKDFETKDFNSDSLTWYVNATINYGTFRLKDPQLTPEATSLIHNPDQFKQVFGTSFIFAEQKAATITAVFSMSHLSSHEFSLLNASLDVSGSSLFSSGRFSTQMQNLISSAVAQSKLECNIYAEGGNGVPLVAFTISNPDDLARLQSNISNFVASINESNAVAIAYFPMDIAALASGVGPVQLPSLYELAIQEYYFDYVICKQKLEALNDVLSHNTCWIPSNSVPQLQQAKSQYLKLEAQILSQAAKIKTNSESISLPDIELPRVEIPMPRIVQVNIYTGGQVPWLWGYVQGGNFDYLHIFYQGQDIVSAPLLTWDEIASKSQNLGKNLVGSLWDPNWTGFQSIVNSDKNRGPMKFFFISPIPFNLSADNYSFSLEDCEQRAIVTTLAK
ncbi:MAG TPA: hypothetical protein VH597_17410 [Verrucomicrobiae bacterium]|jgi:hypothetical protein|nr:hypothetical protein [Verrucomicrobiae bacterium]